MNPVTSIHNMMYKVLGKIAPNGLVWEYLMFRGAKYP